MVQPKISYDACALDQRMMCARSEDDQRIMCAWLFGQHFKWDKQHPRWLSADRTSFRLTNGRTNFEKWAKYCLNLLAPLVSVVIVVYCCEAPKNPALNQGAPLAVPVSRNLGMSGSLVGFFYNTWRNVIAQWAAAKCYAGKEKEWERLLTPL